ncbi:transcription factor bHLH36-like [Rosa rugosa]|uniref:transcription factor bHLH36-like n=1 Tax=Rosa rugosa TaxID=74645 RepID=UPI002B40B24B|nr:transcription factor bHLH36-like [Rosa rugosa]
MDNDQPCANSIIDDSQKKMMHRDIERKRRQEMAALYASLRSTLPPQSIKGKRSLADHMNEAVNQIKHLQTRIKELGAQRDDLKIQTSSPDLSCTSALGLAGNLSGSTGSSSSLLAGNFSRSRVAVNPCLGGVEIVIISCVTGASAEPQGVVLSRLLQILLEQGLTVINCATTQVNKRLVYTIQSEVSNPSYIDFHGLEQTLAKVVSSSTGF